MPQWTIDPVWKDAEVIIIGGGNSLRDFKWDRIKDESTIGVNAAYHLGQGVCSVVVFGDRKFFVQNKRDLANYGGPVFTNCRRLLDDPTPWLFSVPRKPEGLHHDALGWNGNTGATAINLAFLLGATRVFLLGFDMMPGERGKNNWHDHYQDPRKQTEKQMKRGHPYDRFLGGFHAVHRDWKEKFSDREIINVSNDSALRIFPVVPVQEFLKGRQNG